VWTRISKLGFLGATGKGTHFGFPKGPVVGRPPGTAKKQNYAQKNSLRGFFSFGGWGQSVGGFPRGARSWAPNPLGASAIGFPLVQFLTAAGASSTFSGPDLASEFRPYLAKKLARFSLVDSPGQWGNPWTFWYIWGRHCGGFPPGPSGSGSPTGPSGGPHGKTKNIASTPVKKPHQKAVPSVVFGGLDLENGGLFKFLFPETQRHSRKRLKKKNMGVTVSRVRHAGFPLLEGMGTSFSGAGLMNQVFFSCAKAFGLPPPPQDYYTNGAGEGWGGRPGPQKTLARAGFISWENVFRGPCRGQNKTPGGGAPGGFGGPNMRFQNGRGDDDVFRAGGGNTFLQTKWVDAAPSGGGRSGAFFERWAQRGGGLMGRLLKSKGWGGPNNTPKKAVAAIQPLSAAGPGFHPSFCSQNGTS